MELLKYDEKAPTIDQKPRANFFLSVLIVVIAILKGLSGLVGGVFVASIGLVALPLNAAIDCYKNHCWVWEILRVYGNKD